MWQKANQIVLVFSLCTLYKSRITKIHCFQIIYIIETIIFIFSKNLLVYYCKCCILIGYATRYLFVDSRVAASNARNNEHKFVLLQQLDYSLPISRKR